MMPSLSSPRSTHLAPFITDIRQAAVDRDEVAGVLVERVRLPAVVDEFLGLWVVVLNYDRLTHLPRPARVLQSHVSGALVDSVVLVEA